MTQTVDSYRFLSGLTKRLVKSWIKLEEPRAIPWTPLTKPLSECTVAMISTGGLALETDQPFDQAGERQNPWWGDPSYRCIPRTSTEEDVRLYHLHVDPRPVEEDLNCLFPLERLLEMEECGQIGRSASCHFSIMGYILQPQTLLEESTPEMIGLLQGEEVDAVVLVPA